MMKGRNNNFFIYFTIANKNMHLIYWKVLAISTRKQGKFVA